MVDLTRTKAELLNIFADGQASGEITEQDLRDFIATLFNPKDGITLPASTNVMPALRFNNGVLLTTPQDGVMEYSDGHWYITNGSRKVIDVSDGIKLDTTTVTNDNTEQLLYSYTLDANTIHLTERIYADISGSYTNDSASDDFTIRAKINGTTVHTINRIGGNVSNSGWKLQMEGTMRSIGASGSFIDMITFTDGDGVYTEALDVASPLDTSVDVVYEVFVQWDNAKVGNTFSCTQGTMSFKH